LDALTLAIPPGQLKYARLVAEPEARAEGEMEEQGTTAVENAKATPISDTKMEGNDTPTGPTKIEIEITAGEADSQVNGTESVENVKQNGEAPTPDAEVNKGGPATTTKNEEEEPSIAVSEGPDTYEDVVLHEIKTLQKLERKVLEIDGRLNPKDVPSVNAWRFCRCKRNNQDLGTLFEMREDFYVYKHPQIVKDSRDEPMKARNGRD